ncbi:MAG TPA: hypothetical protein VFC77_12525 [Myxococcota bacterium]|nr:hypothetical protein [Myxococcota bacterium]
MSRRLEKILAGAVLLLLVVLAVAAQILTPGEEPLAGSAASAAPEGRRALLLLLRDLGYPSEIWSEAPAMLPRGGGLLWMAQVPAKPLALDDEEPEPDAEEPEPDVEETPPEPDPEPAAERAPSPASLGLRASSHYRRFLEEGGTIVLRFDDEARKFLIEELGLAACEDVHASRVAAAGLRRVRDHRGENLEIEVEEGGVLLPPPAGSSGEALWWGGAESAEGEDVLATMVPVGSGQLVLLGDDACLSNERLREHDHALLAVRLTEHFARDGRILFDEYALGLWRPRTAITLLASPSLWLATAQVVALLFLALWSAAWVREFPRDPRALESASPLLRARALAALLARAGRFDVLGRFLQGGMLRSSARGSRKPAEPTAAPAPTCRSAEQLEVWNERWRKTECKTS